MPALLAVAAAAAIAAASDPSRSLPYDSPRDPVVSGAAGAAWALSQVFEDQLAPATCRWCDPPGFDAAARDLVRWEDPAAAGIASDVLAYGAVPLLGLGVDFFVSGRDAKAAGTDALIAAESLALAGLLGQAVKFAVARERPGARARVGTGASRDEHASFYSGHTSSAFAVAVSLATSASLRGDSNAWVAWAAGLPLAAATGYLRMAADRHYLSDVLAGAGAGALFGILVPRLLHSPDNASPAQPGPARFPALTFGGRF